RAQLAAGFGPVAGPHGAGHGRSPHLCKEGRRTGAVMTDIAATPTVSAPSRRAPRFDVKHQGGFWMVAVFCIAMLYGPMAVLVSYAFNDNQFVMIWKGFTWRWFSIAVNDPEIRDAALLSLKVAAIASVTATIVATMAALVTTRVKPFRSIPIVYAIINQ